MLDEFGWERGVTAGAFSFGFVVSAVAFLYFVLPQISGLEDSWDRLGDGEPVWLVEAAADILPRARVWHLGMYRDEETHRPVSYYNKLQPVCPDDLIIVLDRSVSMRARDASSRL